MPDAQSQMQLAMCAVESLCGYRCPRLAKGYGVKRFAHALVALERGKMAGAS